MRASQPVSRALANAGYARARMTPDTCCNKRRSSSSVAWCGTAPSGPAGKLSDTKCGRSQCVICIEDNECASASPLERGGLADSCQKRHGSSRVGPMDNEATCRRYLTNRAYASTTIPRPLPTRSDGTKLFSKRSLRRFTRYSRNLDTSDRNHHGEDLAPMSFELVQPSPVRGESACEKQTLNLNSTATSAPSRRKAYSDEGAIQRRCIVAALYLRTLELYTLYG